MSEQPRVLLLAEACNPEWTSVPLVAWSHSQAVSKIVNVHLVTQVRNRDAILRAGLVEDRDFTAINSESIVRPARRVAGWLGGRDGKGWTALAAATALSYPYFEYLVWEQFGRRIRRGEFDIVHRLTPLSPTVPSFIAVQCRGAGVPFILGPLNGGVPWPQGFDAARRKEREWLSYVRRVHKLLPGYHATLRNSSAILIGSKDTWKQIPVCYHDKCIYVPENAVDPARFSRRRTRHASRPLRAIFVGRLVPYKGADILLEAAAPLVRAGALTVEIIGDGPQMPLLRQIIEREHLAGRVKLSGWVSHEQVQDHLVEADVFAFPSIREFGGGVVLEAMAVGLVPIVVNYGGPGELVTEQTGYRIEIGRREWMVAEFRRVLGEFSADLEKVDRHSSLCVRRVLEHFTWEIKAEKVTALYLKRRGNAHAATMEWGRQRCRWTAQPIR